MGKIELARAALASALCAACLTSAKAGTVALWLFDDLPGSEVAVDSSGNGHHLSLGPAAAIVSGGKFGNALAPDASRTPGLGAHRYQAEPALNPGDSDWTLECWLKGKPEMPGDNRIWGLAGVSYVDYGRGNSSGGLYVANRFLPLSGTDDWNLRTGDLSSDGRYHHFALVYDAKARELRHYFDGRRQFTVKGEWKSVATGAPPHAQAVFPPHYPTLHVGMRDGIQQWDHRELHADRQSPKAFQGHIDEIRFSDAALYTEDFDPPGSFVQPRLRVWPEDVSFVAIRGEDEVPSAKLSVSSGAASPDWSLLEDIDWLTCNPASADEGGEVRVTADAANLSPGCYTDTIEVLAPGCTNSPVTVDVQLAVIDVAAIRDVGDRKQLFIDGRFIDSSHNVRLRMQQPEKVDIEFEAAREGPLYPCNIIRDPATGAYRMYYGAFHRSSLRYATCTDGIHWKQPGPDGPDIGIVAKEGASAVQSPLAFGAAVMLDPADVPARRYKAFLEKRFPEDPDRNGVYACYSADGFHFVESGRVMPILAETPLMTALWDARIRKYAVYMRVMNTRGGLKMIQGNQFLYRPGFTYDEPDGHLNVVAPESMFVPGYENIRSIGRIETDDLLAPWPLSDDAPSTVYTTPEHVPLVMAADKWDGFADFYTGPVCVYPYAQDVYLMFPTVFRHFHPTRQPYFHRFSDANGPIETQLAVSRDGIHWERPERTPYVPPGRTDQWDRWLNMLGVGMVRVGNDLYQYYWGTSRLHDSVHLREELESEPLPPCPSGANLGAVRQRLDGFVAAETDYTGGWLTTPPLTFAGDRLRLNHDCGGIGTIFVEVQDLNGCPFAGFALGDCEEITGNDVAWEVRWRGSGDVSSLAGKPVRLHFRMCRAKLYAFQFTNED